MPCVGSSLFISFAGSRFPVACLSWSVSVGFPHACMSLRVAAGSANVPNFLEWLEWSFDLDFEDKMLLEYDDNLDTTRRPDHMNIRGLSKAYKAIESLAFQRVMALLRTDRDHEQKLVLTRLFALHPVAVNRLWCFLTFLKYPLYLSSNLLAQRCALKLPNTQ